MRHIRKFKAQFWAISINVSLGYIGFQSFNDFSKDFLSQRYSISRNESNTISNLILIIPLIFSPIFGFFTDRFARKITLMTVSTCILSISYLLLLIIPESKTPSYIGILPISMIGFSLCIYAVTVWTLIPVLINPINLGTAIGITYAIQNIGLSAIPLIIYECKIIKDDGPGKYQTIIALFMVLSIIATLMSLVLYIVDKIHIRRVMLRTRQYQRNLLTPSDL